MIPRKHVPGLCAATAGNAGPAICVTAGLHGWETSAIAVALKLVEEMRGAECSSKLKGQVTVFPVANPTGTVSMTRVEPIAGQDLNRLFPVSPEGSAGKPIAQIVSSILQSKLFVDIHSAGAATYWPHVLVPVEEALQEARHFGLHFAMVRKTFPSKSGTTALGFAHEHGIESYVLEIGGGHSFSPKWIAEGIDALKSFLIHKGFLAGSEQESTPRERLYSCDARTLLRTKKEALFFSAHSVGDYVEEEQAIGWRVNIADWTQETILAPIGGYLIYLRDYVRVKEQDTLAMILPRASGRALAPERELSI